MATIDDVVEIARNYLRDFPRFFQVEISTQVGRTYDLKHVNVDGDSLYVASVTDGSPAAIPPASYQLRERDGVLRISSSYDMTGVDYVAVEGDHYEWLTPADLKFYAEMAVDLHTHNLSTPLATMAPAVVKVIGINAIVQALWGLLSEYSRDIDVISGESVHIPASQRFRMVQSLLQYWEDEYKRLAQALNIGLDRIEVLNLRRRSKLTNRLVPLYKEREVGDYAPFERLWPEIDDGVINLDGDEDSDDREDVYVDSAPPEGLTNQSYYPGSGQGYY